MKINKQREEKHEKLKKPRSSSSSSSSSSSTALPPRKRLLSASPKPNNGPAQGRRPGLCDHPDPILKKTRVLPNLTECHACGFRTDAAKGKQKLQTLYSEWRVVLLCKKCIVRVETSKICSYCFQESVATECFACEECKRRVHKDCFLKYRTVAPWSYSCSGEDFSVCVDCWVPRPIAVFRGRRNIRRKDKSCEGLDGAKSLEDVTEDANCEVGKKIEAATRAREEALRKAVVARRAMELATNAVDFIAKRNETREKEVVDDAELAFRLHRAMNSSPRISRNFSVAGSGLGSPSREVCTDKKSVSEHLYQDGDSSTDVDYQKPDGGADVRTGDKACECGVKCDTEDENGVGAVKDGELSYAIKTFNSCSVHNCVDSASRSCDEQYKPMMPNRYSLKYCRRNCRSKPKLNGKSNSLYDEFHLVNQTKSTGVLLSCSHQSRTISTFSFQGSDVPLQASSCGSDSFQDSPEGIRQMQEKEEPR